MGCGASRYEPNKECDVMALAAIRSLWLREMKRFYRQRSRVIGASAQPIFFWILLGTGFWNSFRLPSGDPTVRYIEYLFPGMVILTLLFTAIFATISIIEDRKEGFLQSVLIAPIPRSVIVLGNVFGATTLAVGQSFILLMLAPLVGISYSLTSIVLIIGLLLCVALALSSLGFIIAWRMDSTQGFHAIMNLLLIPLWLLSGAFFPMEGVPAWLATVMRFNPLSYAMSALRQCLYFDAASPTISTASLPVSFLVTIAFAALMITVANWVAARNTKIS